MFILHYPSQNGAEETMNLRAPKKTPKKTLQNSENFEIYHCSQVLSVHFQTPFRSVPRISHRGFSSLRKPRIPRRSFRISKCRCPDIWMTSSKISQWTCAQVRSDIFFFVTLKICEWFRSIHCRECLPIGSFRKIFEISHCQTKGEGVAMLLKANLGALSILCPLVQVAFSNGMPEEVAWSVTGSHQFSPRETRVAFHSCAWNMLKPYGIQWINHHQLWLLMNDDGYQLHDPRFCSNSDREVAKHLYWFHLGPVHAIFPHGPMECVGHRSWWMWQVTRSSSSKLMDMATSLQCYAMLPLC